MACSQYLAERALNARSSGWSFGRPKKAGFSNILAVILLIKDAGAALLSESGRRSGSTA
jgi:hypothetical protein